MKRTNGSGSVYKLSGNRRKPWCTIVLIGDDAERIVRRTVVLRCWSGGRSTVCTVRAEGTGAVSAIHIGILENILRRRFYGISIKNTPETANAWTICL